MYKTIATVTDAGADFTTADWVYLTDDNKQVISSARITIVWEGITGTKDGDIYLEITNNLDDVEIIYPKDSTGTTILVATQTNAADCMAFNISAPFIAVRMHYEHNSISAGTIDCKGLLCE